MPTPRGQGMRQALAQVSASPSMPLQSTTKSRLYRISHDLLPDGFLGSQDSINLGSCRFFGLRLKRLSQDIIYKINSGPSFLSAAYPPGLLHARHEKYRAVNNVTIDTWRTGEETEEDHQRAEDAFQSLLLQRLPILGGRDDYKIPALVVTSKKRVDKLSVVRHKVNKKVWRSFDIAVSELEGTRYEIQRSHHWLHLISATEDAYQASVEDIVTDMLDILRRTSQVERMFTRMNSDRKVSTGAEYHQAVRPVRRLVSRR